MGFRPLAGINCNSKTDSFSFAILVYYITFRLFLTIFFYFGTYFFLFFAKLRQKRGANPAFPPVSSPCFWPLRTHSRFEI